MCAQSDIVFSGFENDTIHVLATGQSNMIGRCSLTGDTTGAPNFEYWNGVNNWLPGHYGSPPFTNKNNIAYSFCSMLAEKMPNKHIRLILLAFGGNPIENWIPAVLGNYAALENQIVISGVPRINIILWHQGEANYDAYFGCNDDVCYKAYLDTLITQFRAEPWFDATTGYFIAGGLAPGTNYDDRNVALETLNFDGDTKTAFANPENLVTCDGVHITGDGLVSMGRRMFMCLNISKGKAFY